MFIARFKYLVPVQVRQLVDEVPLQVKHVLWQPVQIGLLLSNTPKKRTGHGETQVFRCK